MKRIVIPGELIGTMEEYIPGKGTFEEGGKIYAKTLGKLLIRGRSAVVVSKKI